MYQPWVQVVSQAGFQNSFKEHKNTKLHGYIVSQWLTQHLTSRLNNMWFFTVLVIKSTELQEQTVFAGAVSFYDFSIVCASYEELFSPLIAVIEVSVDYSWFSMELTREKIAIEVDCSSLKSWNLPNVSF